LPEGVWNILKRDYMDRVGDSESEVIRNIVIAYLSDKGYFINSKGQEDAQEIKDKLLVTESLLESVIDALEEKTEVTYEDIDRIMKKKIADLNSRRAKSTS
jgi:hypothetical protein